MIEYIHNDVEHWADEYTGDKFHAILCDPPYGLNEEELDTAEILKAWMGGEHYEPRKSGFMSRKWDSIVPGPRIWAGLRKHAHPGAYLFAFCGTRTADLLSIAIRLAGWEKVDEIQWLYGNGFPKNHNISKAIDRKAGVKGGIIGQTHDNSMFAEANTGADFARLFLAMEHAPATDEARTWDGYGTALKPAHEPILIFRNPITGTYADNAMATGAGGLNIEGARVGHNEPVKTTTRSAPRYSGVTMNGGDRGGIKSVVASASANGRYPANLILGHSPACDDSGCAEGCAVERLGAQSGEARSAYANVETAKRNAGKNVKTSDENIFGRGVGSLSGMSYADNGTAARFFQQIDWSLDMADPFIYIPKAATSEREAGLNHLAPRIVNDGRDTPIDNAYQRGDTLRRNPHPTVKPIALTMYLATLLLPPAAYGPRRICVPFGGVGSEAIGCMLAGWEDVVAIEREAEYIPIGQARIEWWQANGAQYLAKSQNARKKSPAVHKGKDTTRPRTTPEKPAQRVTGHVQQSLFGGD